jgi:hypothetical protein
LFRHAWSSGRIGVRKECIANALNHPEAIPRPDGFSQCATA